MSDTASSAGVRRIEALTGEKAVVHLAQRSQQINEVSGLLKVSPDDLSQRVNILLNERKRLTSEVAELKRKLALAGRAEC